MKREAWGSVVEGLPTKVLTYVLKTLLLERKADVIGYVFTQALKHQDIF